MATSDQPFTGLRLSELGSPAAPSLDQQLFGSPAPATVPVVGSPAAAPSSPAAGQGSQVASNLAPKTDRKQPAIP